MRPIILGWLAASYLLGAIPTSYLVARGRRGIDLRQHGSGNLGATNLYRVMGLRWAVPVALFDIAKGAVPVLVAEQLMLHEAVQPLTPQVVSQAEWVPMLCGLMAVVGHVLSVFVRFKGGKGVATGLGVMLVLALRVVPFALGSWALLVWRTKVMGLGSMMGAAVLGVGVWFAYPDRMLTNALLSALCSLIVLRHQSNLRRWLAGTENKLGQRVVLSEGGTGAGEGEAP